MTGSVLIKNASVVSSRSIDIADVLIAEGRIAAVARDLRLPAEEVIDATGLHALPGVLDPQVHLREPGQTWKEDFTTGSAAAAAGGVTGFFDMPNNKPSITTVALMEEKKKLAASKCLVHYNFFFGATATNLEEQQAVRNVCGIKVFMGASTGDLLVSDPQALERIFATGRTLIAVHAEDHATVQANRQKYAGSRDFADHARIRSPEAALKATKQAVALALAHHRRLHILHLTTQEEAEFLASAKVPGLISTEVCPQHLFLAAPEVYGRLGSKAMMNPPIRDDRHREALWKALRAGVIDCLATDHAPHTLEEKDLPFGEAPSGMPGLETLLPLFLNEVYHKRITLREVVRWLCENPVRLYGVINKGVLRPGYDADLVLVDLKKERKVCGRELLTKVRWSPFEGEVLRGWPVMTWVGGKRVYCDGEVDYNVRGQEIRIREVPPWPNAF
ncbi:MAG: dihydroorotase [Candidatus Omnitrophota bacterium]